MTEDHQNLGDVAIDRRSFVRRAALLAAGSALPTSLLGCGALDIPCLGPAAPPVPVPGMTYIKASEIGCALDCKLETGRNKYGGPATDDGPRINAAMAGATADNPITLIIDGSALVSGLFLPAGGHWSIAGLGCGTGFFIKSGTNNDGIHNGPPNAVLVNDPGPPAPPRGRNVSLSNFTVNGNQGNGYNGNSTTGMYRGTTTVWFFSINLMNLDNITVENVVVVNSPAYHFRFSNVGNVTVSGCVMSSQGGNTDGLHFDGMANDINISNCSFTMEDDAIGLNCPEGYGGNISRVTVSNCTFNSYSLMRLYTAYYGRQFNIDTVNVSRCTGTFSEGAFVIGYQVPSKPNSITGLTISDCKLTGPAVLAIGENFGSIAITNVTFTPHQSNVWWATPQQNHSSGFARTSPAGGITYVGSSLSLDNCIAVANGNMNVPAIILEDNSTINTLLFNGYAIQNIGSSSKVPELLNIILGSIGQVVLGSVDSGNIAAPVSTGGFSRLGSVSGAGVLATGWEFPDAVMADGVPYISASTGLPSIKVGGQVQLYS